MTPSDGPALATVIVNHDRLDNGFAMKTISCPICGPGDVHVVGWRGGQFHRHGQGIETRIVRCRSCRLLYPDPFPFPVDAEAMYGPPTVYFAGQDSQAKVVACRELIRQIAGRMTSSGWSLLDVGCGCGELLRAAALEGVQGAIGLDFSTAMVASAQETYGVDARVQTIEAFAAESSQTFDVVTLCGILEHVHDPDAFMASVASLTRPGSWLYIDIPQEPHLLAMIGNAWSRLLGRKTVYNLSPTWLPFHVFGFSQHSLKVLLAKHGFVIRSHQAWAAPVLSGGPSVLGRFQAFVGTQINRVANLTGTAHNMYVWAQRL